MATLPGPANLWRPTGSYSLRRVAYITATGMRTEALLPHFLDQHLHREPPKVSSLLIRQPGFESLASKCFAQFARKWLNPALTQSIRRPTEADAGIR